MSDLVGTVRERLRTSITDQDDVQPGRLGPRATASMLAADEKVFGFTLPNLLKQLYAEVANGGFGPGYGLLGLTGGVPDDQKHNALQLYAIYRGTDPDDSSWHWPSGLLPICNWGCAIYSCIDCTRPSFPITIFDPNAHEDGKSWSASFFPECESFDHWIELWATGTNLWDRMYGTDGLIARAKERESAR